MATTEILLGNHSAIVGHKQDDGSTTYTRAPGAQVCRLLVPSELEANYLQLAGTLEEVLKLHMTESPEWIECSSPQLASRLANRWNIPTQRPENWEDADEN